MPQERQFHMTVVKQKRIPRGQAEAAQFSGQEPRAEAVPAPRSSAASEQVRRESAAGQSEHKPSAGEERHRSHHRHYQDFGMVNLGPMDSLHDEKAAGLESAGQTRGERQQEFFNKYDAALQRRYSARNRGKLIRILMISLLSALIVILSLLLLTGLRDSAEETLAKPELETIPVASLDLG